jgi:TP901 family phage tail tape measure protein
MNVTAPLARAGGAAIRIAADFEVAMAQVGVATGTPVEGLENLSKLAKQLGADTIFSANEAAQAMLELSKAGLTPAQIEAGALSNTLNLAAASGMGLAESAVIMSAGMNTFKLGASDSVSIVDALAGAANASAADVSDIAMALQQTGQQAVASGLSIQETTAALAAFADAGVRGSDAGTSFKTFLQRLNPVSGEAAKTMKQLGIEFFDAEGNMKDLAEIASEVQKGFSGLTQEQRLAAMQTIFGSDALRAANILYDQGATGIRKYIDASTKSGAASEMANARMSGLSGALEAMKGSIETAALSIGDSLSPAIKDVAGKIQNFANAFANLSPQMQNSIVKFALFAAVVGPMLFILGSLIAALANVAKAIKIVGIALQFLALNPIGIVIVAIAALIALIVILVKNWDDIKQAASNALTRIKEIVTGAKDFIVDKLTALGQWIIANHPLLKLFRAVKDFAPTVLKWFRDLGGDIMDGLKNGIVGSATGFVTAIKNAVKGGVDAVKKLLKIQSPSRVFMGIGENVVAGYIKGVEGMGNALDQTMSGFTMDQTVQLNGSVGASSGTGAPSLAPVYNINVNAGMGADGSAIGREIVDAIKRYERTSGPVFASA